VGTRLAEVLASAAQMALRAPQGEDDMDAMTTSSSGSSTGFSGSDTSVNGGGGASAAPSPVKGKVKILYTIVDRPGGKPWWTRVGAGFLNRDGSINIKLDAIPMSGDLQLRDWEPRENGDRTAPVRAAAPRDLGLTADIPF
jgi:hypothetical protein